MGTLSGVVLFSLFYLCDPILNNCDTGLTKYDELIPYYIVKRFNSMPGLTGLCMSGIFSGSLTTISSAINSLSTVTLVDFIHPYFPNMKEKTSVFWAKGFCLLYGFLCIILTFPFTYLQSVLQIVTVLYSSLDGPICAVFFIGVLTRKGTDKTILSGLLISIPIIFWISFGSLFSGYNEATLSLSTENCSSVKSFSFQNINNSCYNYQNKSELLINDSHENTWYVYKISFVWFPVLGMLFTGCTILFITLITDWKHNAIPADSNCLSPITRYWIKNRNLEYHFCHHASDRNVNTNVSIGNEETESSL